MTLYAFDRASQFTLVRIPVLETARLVLRAPRLDDGIAIAAIANDRRVAENSTRLPFPYTRADAREWLSICNRSEGEASFVITLGGDEVIGACGVGATEGGAPELGYWIGAAYWGNGYATEAVRAVIDFGFADLEFDSLHAGARVSNPISRRVLEKCGFQWTSVGLYRIRSLECSAPVDRFRLDRTIWASLKNWGSFRKVA